MRGPIALYPQALDILDQKKAIDTGILGNGTWPPVLVSSGLVWAVTTADFKILVADNQKASCLGHAFGHCGSADSA